MYRQSKLYKNFIRFLAKVYIFFKVVKSKPKYLAVFIGIPALAILAIILTVCLHTAGTSAQKPTEKAEKSVTEGRDLTEYTQEDSSSDWYDMVDVDLDSLYEVNPDIVGWIYFENSDISYPILQGEDDEYYLQRNALKEDATEGSIFLEALNSPDFNDRHTLIYGHNMKNLSMFGSLKYYKKDGYYEDHPYFQIITEDRETGVLSKYRYHIFAYKDVTEDDDIYYVLGEDYDNISSFAKNSIENNNALQAKEPEEVTNEDYIVTLSTCTSGDQRFVVSAKRCASFHLEE